MTQHVDPCATARNNFLAAGLVLQQCTKTAANIVDIPGKGQIIAMGTKTDVARLLELAPIAAPTQASTAQAEPGKWNVLREDDSPDVARLLDVILRNGVCLMDRQYSKIDWTQVADWRYSAPAAKPDPSTVSAALIHYPDCWDTVAYPTIEDAWRAVGAFMCGDMRNAARYRWLRDHGVGDDDRAADDALLVYKGFGEFSLLPEQLDEAIDAAMAAPATSRGGKP
jgi:hypothetical protein